MFFVLLFCSCVSSSFFFFNDTATTEIYTLSLHDALPISDQFALVRLAGNDRRGLAFAGFHQPFKAIEAKMAFGLDRKSTRLNSSHTVISYAVFCLKKKKKKQTHK